MGKTNNASAWTEEGYKVFANEGAEGIQIERLSRMLKLNKSGFYHYFGDLESFYEELLKLHEKNVTRFFHDIRGIKMTDPGYFEAVVNHKVSFLFHTKLLRSKSNSGFYKLAEAIDQKAEQILRDAWTEYIGFQDQPDLARRYFIMVRDMLYTRLNSDNITYPYLHATMSEARALIQQLVDNRPTVATGRSVY